MGWNASYFRPSQEKIKEAGITDTSSFPVEQVRWFEAIAFCNKLSEAEHLKPYYAVKVAKLEGQTVVDADVTIVGGKGYHLPTDAEWTQGCLAGTTTRFYSGDSDETLQDYAWFDKNSDGRGC